MAEKPPNWPLQSFDARDWAKEFCDIYKNIHGTRPDEGWMIGWFANALMRGFDEHRWRTESGGVPHPEALKELIKSWRSWDSQCINPNKPGTGCMGKPERCELCILAISQMNLAAEQLEAALSSFPSLSAPSAETLDLEPFKEREERLTQLLGVLLERNYLTEAEAAECDDLIYQQALATGLLVAEIERLRAAHGAVTPQPTVDATGRAEALAAYDAHWRAVTVGPLDGHSNVLDGSPFGFMGCPHLSCVKHRDGLPKIRPAVTPQPVKET